MKNQKLRLWQDRLAANETAYAAELAKMDEREQLYRGTDAMTSIVADDDDTLTTPHVRNICAEIIEAQVSSSIPQPKVTAKRKKDEPLAKLIEDMIRGELDRMPFEQINDMAARTVPIQGGCGYLVEWDNTQRTHVSVGEVCVSILHPKQIIPQDGVYGGIEEMDYIILKIPQTKGYIKRRYGVDVDGESEAEPDIRSADGDAAADDMVTQYIAYYRADNGGIGLYSWVGDTELEDLPDYQARRLRRCEKCGAVEPQDSEPMAAQTPDGSYPDPTEPYPEDGERKQKGRCPYCGGKLRYAEEAYEEIWEPMARRYGEPIPGASYREVPTGEIGMDGLPITEGLSEPTRIPYYKPNVYPVVLQKNVSMYGSFLGSSDIDQVKSHQNAINYIEKTIIDKLYQNGAYAILPPGADIETGPKQIKLVRLNRPEDAAMFQVKDMNANISPDMAYLQQVYEESRQRVGVTDSFQGRADRTATSGKAKEFAARQSAGRFESKRVMLEAAYAQLFEMIFKNRLAYADEPRPVLSTDIHGQVQYEEFNRYDFLERDAAGEWYWNDAFLFSCDSTSPLASNREAMWQETRMNFESGAFGNPQEIETQIMFWTQMYLQHYPGAGETKKYLEEKRQRDMMAQQQPMQAMPAQAAMQPPMQPPMPMGAQQPMQMGGMPSRMTTAQTALGNSQGGMANSVSHGNFGV